MSLTNPKIKFVPLPNQVDTSKMNIGTGELYSVFRRNLLSIVCLVLLGLFGGAFYAFYLPDVYTVEAKLVLEPTDTKLFEAVPETADPNLNTETIATELEVINSRLLSARVVDTLGLVEDPLFNPYLGALVAEADNPEPSPGLRERLKELFGLSSNTTEIEISEEAGRTGRILTMEEQRERTITRLMSMINVDRIGRSMAIAIRVSKTDPALAVELANTVADQYLDLSTETRRETTQKAIEFLAERANVLGEEVSEVEQTIAEHIVQYRLDDEQYAASLRAEIEQLKVQQQISLNSSADSGAVDSEVIENELKAKQAMLIERHTAEIALRKMERDATSGQERYLQIISRLGNLDLQAEPLNPRGKILSYAQFPTQPSSPKRLVIIVAGAAVGSVIALLYCILRAGLDNRVRNEEEISRITGMPIFSMVPEIKQKRWGTRLLPHEYLLSNPFSHYSNAIQQLFTGLRSFLPNSTSNIILLTSCIQDEGKTTTALSMAFSAGLEGRHTVLLDADFHKRGASRIAGLAEVRSLDEVIAGTCTLDEAIYHHPDQPNLDVVGFTSFPENAETMLNQDEMKSVLEELKSRYQLVLVDTPPILLASSATVIAKYADFVIVVARWGKMDIETLKGALKKLQMFVSVPLGIAINRVDINRQAKLHYDSSARYQAYAYNSYYRN